MVRLLLLVFFPLSRALKIWRDVKLPIPGPPDVQIISGKTKILANSETLSFFSEFYRASLSPTRKASDDGIITIKHGEGEVYMPILEEILNFFLGCRLTRCRNFAST
jgi:hypothetical protein